jgi:hypothetical protein
MAAVLIKLRTLATELSRPVTTLANWARTNKLTVQDGFVSADAADKIREITKTAVRRKHKGGFYHDPKLSGEVSITGKVHLSDRAQKFAAAMRMTPLQFVDHCVAGTLDGYRKALA